MQENSQHLLTSESIQMLIASVTNSGENIITELEAERLLNAVARVQAGVPTGSSKKPIDDRKRLN